MDKIKFETIMNKFSRQIFNYLLKIVRNREEAEDLLQDVFIAFYKKIDSVQENSYRSYLYQTAYHKALNRISTKKRNKRFIKTIKQESSEPASTNPEDKNEIIKAAFSKLKPEEVYILELQFFQKLSYKEIADQMDTSISAIDSRLVRAKKKLKKILVQEISDREVENYRGDNYEQKIRL